MCRFLQRRWKFIAALFFAGLICGLCISWFVGGALCASTNHQVTAARNLAVEEVAFPSSSGAIIHGWLVTPASNRGVVILQHGMGGSRSDMQERARFLSKAGYAALMFDFQGHGESIGKTITLGHLESLDSQAAVEFVKKRFPGKPVAVIGESLGAVAAALAEPPLDVQALVLEIMYPTIVDAVKDRIEMRVGPAGRWISPLLTAQIKLRIGCSTDDLRPIEHVGKLTTPKLFLAGTEDQDTKLSESKEIFARAAEPKTFASFEGARHEDLHAFAPDRYENLILKFLGEHMK
jgi:alpha-beta hydrolase superfamily lysophospholipase